ncbi:hypothetical protein PV328_008981 [Microctonus aethiopoides]|uniref:Protein sleepless n=1 Tax=Microctonus aethiopoides TaxID=144406 RepID=A0AA39FKS3_9HYME|nr:hypothetical protein PV328_008981 [Microctonus aethiopoides]
MKAQIFLVIFSILIIVNYSSAEALECFVCNSYSDSRCADKEPNKALIQKCDMLSSGGTKYTMCRKTVQTIEFGVNGLPPETRVIRTCGYDESNYKGRCYQRGGFGGRQEVCSCLTNHCNAATPIFEKAPHLILMLLCIIGSAVRTFVGN